MATQMATILTAFNDHFMEFVNDIHSVVPENTDILAAKNSFALIRKANPKMIIKIWQSYVVNKYNDKIDLQNLNYETITFDSNPNDNIAPSGLVYYFSNNETIITDQEHNFTIKLSSTIKLDDNDFVF